MMRLGLDLLFLLPGETGGRETYVRALIDGLFRHEPDLSAVGFVNREAAPRLTRELGDRMRIIGMPVSPRRAPSWALGELGMLPVAAARARVDVLHSPANFAPVASPRVRRVVTLHDLQYRAVGDLLSPTRRRGTALMLEPAARRADRLIAVSTFGRDEIVRELGIDPGRIDVIPNGVDPAGPGAPSSEEELRDRLELGDRRVLLTAASDLPHKNLRIVIDALAQFAPGERPLLVLCGPGTNHGPLRAHAERAGVATDVRLAGYQPAEALAGLYRLTSGVMLPSLYEGFGLPVLEAMAQGAPVACSDIPALHEVAGDAALFFEPRNPSAVADAMRALLAGDEPVARRVRAGHERAGRFTWDQAAAATLNTYRRALEAGPRGPIRPARQSA